MARLQALIDPDRIRLAFSRTRERIGRRWWVPVVATGGSLLHAVALWSILEDLGPTVHPPLLDSIIYEYIGWYLSTGARLYVDIWEVKPPLVYEVTALVAVVTGDHMAVYHWTLVAFTLLASVAAALVVGQLVVATTGDPTAAAIAGLTPYTYPLFAWRGAIGFKPKYFVVLFGLLCVYAALTERPLASGLLGAASVGFWQLAVVFPGVAVGILYRRGNRRDLGRLAVGGGFLGGVILFPVIVWGALDEMVVETVLAPFIAGEGTAVTERLWLAIRMLGVPSAVAAFGLYGMGRAVLAEPGDFWWVGALATWLLGQVVFLDFDSAPDLLPLFAVLAIGVGFATALVDRSSWPLAVIVVLVGLAAVSIRWGGTPTGYSWLPPAQPTPVDTRTVPTVPYTETDIRILFWRPLPSETCRAFYGGMQSRYLTRVGLPYASDCGAWTSAWEWVRAHWLP